MKPRYVDMNKCVACGLCAEKCPGKAPDEFNYGLRFRRAIYVPHEMAI
ncbi:MAG: 4Fe-4S binding protein, partial [Candidatus Kapaibacteriota bacterium]